MNGLNIQYKAKRRRPVQQESNEQRSVVLYARAKWPEVPIVCSTRGKKLSGTTQWARIKQGYMTKLEGYESGTPDLFFVAARRGWNGLFIEMKKTGGVQSDVSKDQRLFIARAEKQGYFCTVCFGSGEAVAMLDKYFGEDKKVKL